MFFEDELDDGWVIDGQEPSEAAEIATVKGGKEERGVIERPGYIVAGPGRLSGLNSERGKR